MRHGWIAVGVLAASFLLAGCGGGTDRVSPDEEKSIHEALKKVDPHTELKTGKPASSRK